jgi:single-strand DNA-binding protein
MPHLNKVLLLGHLTRDPELRATPKGASVAQFGLAVNRSFKTETGETREETTFVDLEAWGRQAEAVSRYLGKGSACLVEGRLRLDTWEDKASGERRSRLRVVAENVQFLDRRAPEAEASAAEEPAAPLHGAKPAPAARARRPASAPDAARIAAR